MSQVWFLRIEKDKFCRGWGFKPNNLWGRYVCLLERHIVTLEKYSIHVVFSGGTLNIN